MAFADILVVVLSAQTDEPVLAAAELLSTPDKVHVSATLVSVSPQSAYAFETVGAGAAVGMWIEPPGRHQSDDGDVELKRRLERFKRPVAIERVEYLAGMGAELTGVQSRRASLTMMLRPAGAPNQSMRSAMFENILFESGRPVLVVPPDWRHETLGETILVAWDGSRAATRALADAQPLLARAENVFVVTVDQKSTGGVTGANIAAHLRRIGIRSQQPDVPGSEKPPEAALLEECAAVGADLIVMGGYRHSRLQEKLFGGVTQSLLAGSPAPLLISR
jgi:nucleotide-binding universal stress UspA family protein